MARHGGKPFWFDAESDESAFSTAGIVLALLITLSLVFTGAQVYRVQSSAAAVQEVADAAALAADNVIAEYYLVARVCDAVVLSLSLTGVIVVGMGVAALCTPVTAPAGTTLVQAGQKVLKARDAFAHRAQDGLDKLQKALPLLAAAAAYRVAAANVDATGAGYLGFAIVLPAEGGKVDVGETGAADGLSGAVDDKADDLRDAGREAEDAAKRAKAAKERAWKADCGNNPSYCLYERAAKLAGMAGSDNPYFGSAETWGFSVALERAKAYYPRRLAAEAPAGDSVEERANSALRKRFYAYAAEEVAKGYVHESDDAFEADFPLLPKNTAELRATPLYTEAVYPITVNSEGKPEMHAWDGCPRAAGATGSGSLSQRESGGFALCPACGFTAASLGKVAAASSSIQNGFEYHYRVIAEAAEEYQRERAVYAPKAGKVRRLAGKLFDKALAALKEMAAQRIEVAPPGRLGVVAVVSSTSTQPADAGFASSFVGDAGSLGCRVAIAGAALASDSPEQGKNVLASALDGVRERSGSGIVGAADAVMDVWSAVLLAYADGQARIGAGLDELDSRLSFGSESGLGLWSSAQFEALMGDLGLEPVELDAPKPVLVNTGHVLQADSGDFSARLLSLKRAASGLTGDNLLEGAIGAAETGAERAIGEFDGKLVVAQIEVAGEGSPVIPITVTLPDFAHSGAQGLVEQAAARLREVVGSITGVRQWR